MNKKAKLKISILLSVLVITLLFTSITSGATWYSSDYSKSKGINILENSAGTLTDYNVLLNISYDSDMQSDFDDLRFTSEDNETELSYWIEEKSDSNWASVWVLVPQLNSSSNNTIYMYYGNSSVTTASDGFATFGLFDDFESGSLNTTKWYAEIVNTGGWSVQSSNVLDGSYSLYIDTSGASGYALLLSNDTYTYGGDGYQVSVTAQFIGTTATGRPRICNSFTSGDDGYFWEYYDDMAGARLSKFTSPNTRATVASTSSISHGSNVVDLKMWELSNTYYVTANSSAGNSQTSGTDSTYNGNRVGVGVSNHAVNKDAIFDNIYVRKIVSGEPTSHISAEKIEAVASDSCSYGGTGNWEINLTDYCVISNGYSLPSNNITFVGVGNVTINATISALNIGGLPADQIGYLGSNASVYIG